MEISRPEHASSYPTEVYQRQYPQFLHHNSLQASQHNLIIIYYKLAQPIKEIVPLQSRLIALRLLNILNIFITPSNILRRIHISRRDSSNSLPVFYQQIKDTNNIDEGRKLLRSLSDQSYKAMKHRSRKHITKILSLSYDNLPYYLKSCFLYSGYFPQNYSIRCRRLIRQWIAEDFVKSRKNT
ncbi:hypothetical protein G4B88_020691 [Cannabis sativa]|uniref:Disease resistance protein winged helix domain-containing protein n=1 Tax=Cannabis sativa TaxID=3483 RepID=A0A7J6HLE0_CANSA|nr:hypothetical protein G4B88_020691 [Cannabis sativa]